MSLTTPSSYLSFLVCVTFRQYYLFIVYIFIACLCPLECKLHIPKAQNIWHIVGIQYIFDE